MGELYNPYPKLPKNIRQIGERDQSVKLYVEDYVNTYLKRLYPTGGRELRVGLLVGEARMEDGVPYLFADGALEMEDVARDGERVEFTEEAWKRAYETMEQMFPRRSVLGWFLCGGQGTVLSPLNYWKQHSQYFAAKNQLMYLNCGLEGEEAVYTASEDGFYRLRGYCVYYERNQMMQDYMISRKDARRVESGTRDAVIQDFRQKMEDRKTEADRARGTVSALGTACGLLAVAVLAGGVVMFNNYQKMKAMESVIASALPEGTFDKWSDALSKGESEGELEVEEVPGEVYPTLAEIVIETEGDGESAGAGGTAVGAAASVSGDGTSTAGNSGTGAASGNGGTGVSAGPNTAAGNGGASVSAEPNAAAGTNTSAGSNAAAGTNASAGSNAAIPGGNATVSKDASSAADADGQAASALPVRIPDDAVLHVVEDGETLYGICMERYHSMAQIEEICRWNGLEDENQLSVGQKLYLPPS